MQRDKYEIIQSYANRGRLSVKPILLYPSEIKQLRKDGFYVVPKKGPATDPNIRYECCVSWDNPKGHKAASMLATTIRILQRRLPNDLKSSL